LQKRFVDMCVCVCVCVLEDMELSIKN